MPFMKVTTIMPSLKKEYAFFSLKNPPVEIITTNKDSNAMNNSSQNNNNEQKRAK